MEFFLPGIAALLIAALIVFLVLPRLGAPILAGLSLLLLGYGLYNHYYLFGSEYRFSTWQERLKYYSTPIMIGGLILAILMYLGYLFQSKGANILPASNLTPEASSVAVAVNNTATVANNIATNAMNQVANVVGLGNNRGNAGRNQGVLANLGQMLNTPKRNNRFL